ncbi:hypothetical protein PRZ48_001877 [Zasmidium cellare]|uniref:Uncharacterized protein n=1 Tax=Zasmidium cellare TaxID=395010 RepID=A0ABR0F3G8_ZASCE|nr:hypothetical protein PRZ48_001877 [Zasmidium cellare]
MNTTRSSSGRIKRYLVSVAIALLLAALLHGCSKLQPRHPLVEHDRHDSLLADTAVHQEFHGQVSGDSLFQPSKRQSDSDDPYDSNPPSDQDPSDDDTDGEDDDADEDEVWKQCVNRGCKLNELMQTSDADLEEQYKTKWTNFDDIKKYGWSLSSQEDKAGPNEDDRGSSAPVLRALGIPEVDDPSWKKVPWVHDTETKVDGKTYPTDIPPHTQPTQVEHTNFYNPSHGIIIAANNRSPLKNQAHVPPDRVTPLNRWSDLTCNLHHQDPSNLKYVLRMNVFSDDVDAVLPRVIGKDLADLTEAYPGVAVGGVPDSQGARAAVGFSNGRGVAWLLIQHKGTFGERRFVKGVNVWDSYNGHRPPGLLPGLDEIPNVLFTLS